MFYVIKTWCLFSVLFCACVLSIDQHRKSHLTGEEASGPFKRPNVIIFLADDLGYGDLSFSGHPSSQTTHIDTLASNGKYLTNFYVTSPVCSPSRASLLTGRYQMRSGVYPAVFYPPAIEGLPKTETTIANILKNLGYKTEIIGKWHLGVGLQRQFLPGKGSYGFDNYLGVPYSHDMCPCPVCHPNNGTCWSGSGCWLKFSSCPLFRNQEIVDQPIYFPTMSQRYLKQAKQFISQSNREGVPFFLYMPFPHIHLPQFASKLHSGKNVRGETGDSLLELDWMVGEIMSLLGDLKIGNSTLTWFTSDNGPDLGHHERGGNAGLLRCGKGTTWDGGVRVPSIIHWPGKIRPSRSNALVSTLDMLPTISTIVGTKYENLTLDGIDVSAVLFDELDQSPRTFYAVYPQMPSEDKGPFAVFYKQFKAHFFTKGSSMSDDENPDPMCRENHKVTKHDPPLLFNLYQDPGERYDLGSDSEYSEILKTITEWRHQHMSSMTWIPSVTQAETARTEPCCSDSACEPFPGCCDCRHSSNSCEVENLNC